MATRDTGTEQLIKETAKQVFFAEGRLHATTQDIADAAGISRTSLHYYYRSRDELMKQVFNEATNELSAKLYSVMDSALPFREKIEKTVSLFISDTMMYPYRETFMVTEMLDKDVDLYRMKKEGSPYIKRFLKEVEKEMEAGSITCMKPEQFLMNLFALTAHPLLMRPVHRTLFNLSDERYNRLMNERKKMIVDLILR